MSWMQFIIELLDKITWPLVLVFFFIIMRQPLSALIPLAKKVKYKEFEVEFNQELKALTEQAQGEFPEFNLDKKSLITASADNLPNSAVLEAWKEVDDAAEKLIKSLDQNIDLNISTRYKLMENILLSEKIVDSKKGKLFNELRQLRNKVAHAKDFEVGKTQALQYIELCFVLADHLNRLADKSVR
ncbi:HEPN domain-containing protein [Psychromonas aquimarina]|uniref:HEPN domain-containing protein n=1 Tax=Psychromonas aquimarina TaxID=444919 RepID=UPI0003F527AD|nr:HEPN domain-containing protein [Psychromonas aquimarina]